GTQETSVLDLSHSIERELWKELYGEEQLKRGLKRELELVLSTHGLNAERTVQTLLHCSNRKKHREANPKLRESEGLDEVGMRLVDTVCKLDEMNEGAA